MGLIYTVGKTDIYEELFLDGSTPQKKGADENYVGGSVWKTAEAAESYLRDVSLCDYRVYGVIADWEEHTESNGEKVPFRNLLIDADLVRLQK